MNYKPGDKIRCHGGIWDGCEATVTYSLNEYNIPVCLITSDPENWDVGARISFYNPNNWEVIAPVNKESDLHQAIDNILPFV